VEVFKGFKLSGFKTKTVLKRYIKPIRFRTKGPVKFFNWPKANYSIFNKVSTSVERIVEVETLNLRIRGLLLLV